MSTHFTRAAAASAIAAYAASADQTPSRPPPPPPPPPRMSPAPPETPSRPPPLPPPPAVRFDGRPRSRSASDLPIPERQSANVASPPDPFSPTFTTHAASAAEAYTAHTIVMQALKDMPKLLGGVRGNAGDLTAINVAKFEYEYTRGAAHLVALCMQLNHPCPDTRLCTYAAVVVPLVREYRNLSNLSDVSDADVKAYFAETCYEPLLHDADLLDDFVRKCVGLLDLSDTRGELHMIDHKLRAYKDTFVSLIPETLRE